MLDNFNAEEIIRVFKVVRDHKEEASNHNSLATEALKILSKKLDLDKTVLTDVYKKWDDAQGEQKLEDVVLIFETIKGK